jgi:hypothetical protein
MLPFAGYHLFLLPAMPLNYPPALLTVQDIRGLPALWKDRQQNKQQYFN